MQSYQQQAKTRLIASCIAILVIAGTVFFIDNLKNQSNSSTTSTVAAANDDSSAGTSTNDNTTNSNSTAPSTNNGSTPGNSSSTSSTTYTDGSYSAESEYSVPHGFEDIKVTVTLKNGVVTAASIQNSEGDPESARFQENFASAYKQYVVGKNLSDINLSFVAGASDTSEGFNEALQKITTQAEA